MSDVTISEEEFRRLKALAGEADEPRPSVEMCSLTGHAWQSFGGCNAGCEMPECDCSIAVYQCAMCGACDYGERDRQETHDNCFARKEWLEEQEAARFAADVEEMKYQ